MKIKGLEEERKRRVARIEKLATEIRESGIMNDYFDDEKK